MFGRMALFRVLSVGFSAPMARISLSKLSLNARNSSLGDPGMRPPQASSKQTPVSGRGHQGKALAYLQAAGRYLAASVVPVFLSPQVQRLPASVVITVNLPP